MAHERWTLLSDGMALRDALLHMGPWLSRNDHRSLESLPGAAAAYCAADHLAVPWEDENSETYSDGPLPVSSGLGMPWTSVICEMVAAASASVMRARPLFL